MRRYRPKGILVPQEHKSILYHAHPEKETAYGYTTFLPTDIACMVRGLPAKSDRDDFNYVTGS